MKKVKLFPVCREIGVDLETPVSAFLKLQKQGAKLLLESVEKGEQLGRYSFIGLNPSSILKIENDSMNWNGTIFPFKKREFIQNFRRIIYSHQMDSDQELPPFSGGWVGYLGYDVNKYLENLPSELPEEWILPLGVFYLVKDVLVFDHVKHRAKVISLVSSREEEQNALKNIKNIQLALEGPLPSNGKNRNMKHCKGPLANFKKGEFEKIVRSAKEYILAGDILQVVLSQRYSGETDAFPFDIYRMLRMINPSPYMFFLDFNDFHLIGSSPEALVRLNDKKATLHPIAGTRPRGESSIEDKKLEDELMSDEKERAEHVMLVDLARNDLGRVCLPGTIKVKKRMNLEKYSHVMHLVSEAEGIMGPNVDALDLLKASFPAGTVTGAPKIRAMEIIEELEKVKRGPYSGTVGYFGLDGNMDMCIAIRMIICRGKKYHLQAGAGIVADSVPSLEYKETINKMKGLYQAIKYAQERRNDFINR